MKIDRHGRDVLNFQITMTILLFVAIFLMMLGPIALIFLDNGMMAGGSFGFLEILVLIVSFTLIGIGFFVFFQGIKNTLKVLAEKDYHYPLSIPFLKSTL